MTRNQQTRCKRSVSTLLVIGAMLLSMMALAPAADAQGTTFSRDLITAPSATCTANGTIANADNAIFNGSYCRPVGFTPVTTLAGCMEAAMQFSLGYTFNNATSQCYVGGFNVGATSCEAPSMLVTDLSDLTNSLTGVDFSSQISSVCVLPMLSNALPPLPPAGGQGGPYDGIHVCIESDEVQNAPAAKGLGVSASFVAADGTQYIITAGGPTCDFDPNGCNLALNFWMVDDVKTCLAEKAAAAAAPAPAAEPAVAAISAPAAPAAELAHTGQEHVALGGLATALLGAGCAALGLGREARRRRNP